MSKHTAGPWHSDGERVVTKTGRVRKVADVYPPERAANARLIAAAPEMLEMLRRFVAIERGMTSANAGTRTTERLATAEALLARIDVVKP